MSGQQGEGLTLPQGFEPAQATIKHRLILSVQKRQKHGGTHFALTAPGPIAYCNFDKDSREDVLPKFVRKGKAIYDKTYWLDRANTQSDLKDIAQAKIDEFKGDFSALLTTDVKSIVIDTSTELYAYVRLAMFGKLTQVKPHHYTVVNAWFRELLDSVSYTDKNIVFLERRKKEYIDNDWTGNYERSGFSETPFLVQANIMLERVSIPDPGTGVYPFELTVMDSSQNPLIKGLKLQSDPSREANWQILTGDDKVDRELTKFDQASFPWLGVHVFPETTLKDWV